MKFGVRDGVLRQGWEQSFGEAAWLGFDGVELDVGAKYEDSLLWTDHGRLRLRQMQAGTGMDLAGLCLGGLWEISAADASSTVRSRAIELISQAAAYCRDVDCGVMLIPITPGKGSSPAEQRDHWIAALKESAPAAASAQVVLAIENVGSGCAQSAEALLDIIRSVASPAVQAYYDPGNAILLGQDPVKELYLLKGAIRQLHAKDPGGKYLGGGRAPFPEVVEAVREIGYDGYIVLETDPTDDPVTAAAENLQFLQEKFA